MNVMSAHILSDPAIQNDAKNLRDATIFFG